MIWMSLWQSLFLPLAVTESVFSKALGGEACDKTFGIVCF